MQTIEQAIKEHASHLETVSPGLPAAFGSLAIDEGIAQGDLYLFPIAKVPDGYREVTGKDKHRQLVPESGAGSHHRLSDVNAVDLYYPDGWSVDDANYESTKGPVFVTHKEVVVLHEPGTSTPHGPVTIPAGATIECTYQRVWWKEEARERRQKD